jgi:ribosomal protein S27AE
MGRTYWFECSKCGYRAQVSGKPDRGSNFFVQTIACEDCRALYDVVVRLKIPEELKGLNQTFGLNGLRFSLQQRNATAPSFQAALNRLPHRGVRRYKWVHFKAQCPVSSIHRVQSWSENDKCPRCGLFLDKNALPYRIWE